MSRDIYGPNVNQARSPKPMRREMPHVGQASPTSKPYTMPQSASARASPITPAHHRQLASPSQPRKSRHIGGSRSSNSSPLTLPPEGHVGHVPHSLSSSAFNVTGSYYGYDLLNSPVMDTRSASASGHRSRSTTRGNVRSYHSLERDHETEFIPIRDRSLDRGEHLHHRARDRSLDRLSLRDGGGIIDDDPYRDPRSARHSPNPDMRGHVPVGNRDAYIIDLQNQLGDMQKEYSSLKKELDMTNQKLGSSMHSIKTFWSPELKKERALRKEESAKYSLINDQLKLLNSENQACQSRYMPSSRIAVSNPHTSAPLYSNPGRNFNWVESARKQATLIHQLEDELRSHHLRNPDLGLQQQLEQLYAEKQHQAKEIYLLRETIKEMELRIETQKQTLQAREESIKKLLEMLQTKGAGGKLQEDERLEYERMKTQLIEAHARARHLESLVESKDKDFLKTKEIEEARMEVQKRDQEILAMGAKMRTLEEQHQDYQRHIAVLKESLCAKEEHYNMLQTDVEELRQRLEEKNKLIEKKTQQALQAQQERNRLNSELNELKDHMDIKDRKINVLQRKVEVHDMKERASAAKGKEGEVMQRQLEEKQKQLEEREKMMNEKNKVSEDKTRKLEERQRALEEMDKRLRRKKEKIDEMEAHMQKAEVGQNEALAKQIAELRKRNQDLEKENKANKEKEKGGGVDAARQQQELDRLLKLLSAAEDEKFAKDKQIQDLQTALNNIKRSQQAGAHGMEEARKREDEARKETSKTQTHLKDTQERVEELEEALRQSLRITTEREMTLEDSLQARKTAEERIKKLEERLKSLQNAHNLRCTNCPVVSERLTNIEQALITLKAERKKALEELFDMKQEALAAAVSEKDAHIALLEMSGVKNYKTAEQVDTLKAARKTIVDKMKTENEKRVDMLKEWTDLSEVEAMGDLIEENGKDLG